MTQCRRWEEEGSKTLKQIFFAKEGEIGDWMEEGPIYNHKSEN
jgi:hypothetical protein